MHAPAIPTYSLERGPTIPFPAHVETQPCTTTPMARDLLAQPYTTTPMARDLLAQPDTTTPMDRDLLERVQRTRLLEAAQIYQSAEARRPAARTAAARTAAARTTAARTATATRAATRKHFRNRLHAGEAHLDGEVDGEEHGKGGAGGAGACEWWAWVGA